MGFALRAARVRKNRKKDGGHRVNAKLRDESSSSAFYLQHRSLLRRFLTRFFSHPQDIEDVVQETFLRACQAQKTTELRSPAAFLVHVARNLALNELDARRRMVTNYPSELCAGMDVSSAEEQSMVNEQLAIFYQAAVSLPPQCQKAFLMRKVYGLSHQEIAKELNIAVSTVEKHLAAGLVRCNEFLKSRGYEPVRRRTAAATG